MAFGTAPGQVLKNDWEDVEDGGGGYNRSIYDMIRHFMYHPGVKFGRKSATQDELAALGATFKRLRKVYTDESIYEAIDRYYLTRSSQSDNPIFAFCSKNLQARLFRDLDEISVDSLSPVDTVMEWFLRDFERGTELDLPWDGELDLEISMEFVLDAEFNVLLRTYPDVVAKLLLLHHDGEWLDMLEHARDHFQWLMGIADKSDPAVRALGDILPYDFRHRAHPRKTFDLVEEAVRSIRGR